MITYRFQNYESHLYAIVESLQEGVIFQAMNGKILTANKKAADILGIPRAALLELGFLPYECTIVDESESIIHPGHLLYQDDEKTTLQKKRIIGLKNRGAIQWLQLNANFVRTAADNDPYAIIISFSDITEEKKIKQEKEKSEVEQQKEINRIMIKTQENERNQLGRELHDNINQILAVIKLQLEFALENYDNEKPTFERCKINIDHVIKEIRQLSHRLVLPRFAENGLQQELEKMIHMIYQQQPVILDTSQLNENNLPDNVKETLYRIIQEQLNNIIKHAKASKAIIRLQNNHGSVALQIEDNGNGFNLSQSRNGVGITNILNRVESYNGSAKIFSEPGKGCRLHITIPLKEQA